MKCLPGFHLSMTVRSECALEVTKRSLLSPENVNTMYQRILHDPLRFPDDMPSEAKSLMTGLLSRDPNRRLGVNGAEEIKRHPWFARNIDWARYGVFVPANTYSFLNAFPTP